MHWSKKNQSCVIWHSNSYTYQVNCNLGMGSSWICTLKCHIELHSKVWLNLLDDWWHWQFDGLGEFVQLKILTIISYKSDFCCYNVNMRWGSGVLMNLYTLKNLSVRSYNSDFCCLNANLRCPIRYGLLVHQDGVNFFSVLIETDFEIYLQCN